MGAMGIQGFKMRLKEIGSLLLVGRFPHFMKVSTAFRTAQAKIRYKASEKDLKATFQEAVLQLTIISTYSPCKNYPCVFLTKFRDEGKKTTQPLIKHTFQLTANRQGTVKEIDLKNLAQTGDNCLRSKTRTRISNLSIFQ